jgi:hypothetical protein
MNTTTNQLTERVDDLLAILEKDIEHINGSIEKLERMRELVIKRDDSALKKLLEKIRLSSEEYSQNLQLREQSKQQVAENLGCSVEQVRLSRLQMILPVEQSRRVGEVREQLERLVSRLRTEHAGTAVLLADLARFNSILLNTILETGRASGITYNARGDRQKHRDGAFVNLEF